MTTTNADLIIAKSKDVLPLHLNKVIAAIARQAIATRDAFSIALSGGSLASFLASLGDAFQDDPEWEKWHVLLADERCVPEDDKDSNVGSLRASFFSQTKIPATQIYGISQELLLTSTTAAVAEAYEKTLRKVMQEFTGGCLDLAVLGFGPDGHTCSLFPDHALLKEQVAWVAPITDSPKPPPNRITLTFPVLNEKTRHVIVCGAGASKGPILQKVIVTVQDDPAALQSYAVSEGKKVGVEIQRNPPPYPCAQVAPHVPSETEPSTLTWVVDEDAMKATDIKY